MDFSYSSLVSFSVFTALLHNHFLWSLFLVWATTSGPTGRMECRGGMPLLLMLLAGTVWTVSAEQRTLDMAPNAVDDIFSGCRDRMIQNVTAPGGLLEKELEANQVFTKMWNHSGTCGKQIYGAIPQHLAALQAYGNSAAKFRKTFNGMVQTKGSNSTTYLEEFPFKSLHFLLTDALLLLNPGNTCNNMYFGTSNLYTTEPGKEVRFGRFISGSMYESLEIEKFAEADGGTLFNLYSCSLVNVEKATCKSEEVEQLILPNEVFTVQSVKTAWSEDVEYTEITLTHSRFQSNHDCYLFP
ncbi:hypothetical protein NFI96_017019, partial [Prochilodus magdalenae]